MYDDNADFESTFEYTDEAGYSPSDLIGGLFYNSNDQTLVVNLDPADDSEVDLFYSYSNVPSGVYEDFAAADSRGGYYNRFFKRKYGPGEVLGDFADVLPVKAEIASNVVPNPSWNVNWVGSATALGFDDEDSIGGSGLVNGIDTAVSQFNPGAGISLTPEPVAEVKHESNYITLALASDNSALRKFVVSFVVDGSDEVLSHELYASDWNNAEAAVVEIGNMLNLDFTVKGMSVLD